MSAMVMDYTAPTKVPRYRVKSAKCKTNHCNQCTGIVRLNHGIKVSCECPHHSAVQTDPKES